MYETNVATRPHISVTVFAPCDTCNEPVRDGKQTKCAKCGAPVRVVATREVAAVITNMPVAARVCFAIVRALRKAADYLRRYQ